MANLLAKLLTISYRYSFHRLIRKAEFQGIMQAIKIQKVLVAKWDAVLTRPDPARSLLDLDDEIIVNPVVPRHQVVTER